MQLACVGGQTRAVRLRGEATAAILENNASEGAPTFLRQASETRTDKRLAYGIEQRFPSDGTSLPPLRSTNMIIESSQLTCHHRLSCQGRRAEPPRTTRAYGSRT